MTSGEICEGYLCTIDPGVSLNTGEYSWTVQPSNASGSGETSVPGNFTVGFPTPSGIYATDGKYQNKIYINWPEVNGSYYYDLIRSTSPSMYGSIIYKPTNNAYVDTTALPGQTYYYRVRACLPGDCTPYSNNNAGFVAHDSVGLYRVSNGYFRLRLSNSPGPTDIAYRFGPLGTVPLMGDWDGDGKDTPGVYDPSIGYFRLRNSNSVGTPNYAFQFGPINWDPDCRGLGWRWEAPLACTIQPTGSPPAQQQLCRGYRHHLRLWRPQLEAIGRRLERRWG